MLMSPKELKRRLAKGEDPLDLSIEKWERVVQNPKLVEFPYAKYTRAGTCGLCAVYIIRVEDDEYDCGCRGCPLMSLKRGHCCEPNSLWWEVTESLSKKEFLVAAQAMLEALKKCKIFVRELEEFNKKFKRIRNQV